MLCSVLVMVGSRNNFFKIFAPGIGGSA